MSEALYRWRRTATVVLAIYWIALFIGTHVPLDSIPEGIQPSDKLMHFLAYAGLNVLFGCWVATRHSFGWIWAVGMLLLSAVYGAADELLQIPVGRQCALDDWIADVLGSIMGLAIFTGILAYLRRGERSSGDVSQERDVADTTSKASAQETA